MSKIKTLSYSTDSKITGWELDWSNELEEVTKPDDKWRYFKAGKKFTLTLKVYEDEC